MLENLVFSLNKVLPFFLLILLGYGLKRWKFLPDPFLAGLNKFVYRLALPLNLFYSTATTKVSFAENGRYVLFAFLLTLASFAVFWIVTELLFRDKTLVGTLVQGCFRGNFSLLGIPLATAVVGAQAAAPAAMALAIVIPMYSTLSVLALVTRGTSGQKPSLKGILKGIATSPLIIAILLGLLVSSLGISLPTVVLQTVDYVAGTATPLGLIAIGGLFNIKSATARLKPAVYASVIKILVLPLMMVPVCYLLGFRGEALFLYFIMFGSPVAVSSYSMATELGGDGPLASNILIITTFFSSLTLSAGIYFMRSMGWI